MEHQEETLLKVEHLCQYFKMGPGRELKAVDDVSFDIKKGEVFGLVGESGCGKTTTGRSIIKLYDITSGNVYFEGQRICAGTRSYKEAIRAAQASRICAALRFCTGSTDSAAGSSAKSDCCPDATPGSSNRPARSSAATFCACFPVPDSGNIIVLKTFAPVFAVVQFGL